MKRLFVLTLFLSVISLPNAQARIGLLSLEEPPSQFGAVLGYGLGIPRSYGGGLHAYNMFHGTYSMTSGGSYALTFNITARAQEWRLTPLLGYNASFVSIKHGDLSTKGYTDGKDGFNQNISAGAGFLIVPGSYLDVGASFFLKQGFVPFVRMSWPLY